MFYRYPRDSAQSLMVRTGYALLSGHLMANSTSAKEKANRVRLAFLLSGRFPVAARSCCIIVSLMVCRGKLHQTEVLFDGMIAMFQTNLYPPNLDLVWGSHRRVR